MTATRSTTNAASSSSTAGNSRSGRAAAAAAAPASQPREMPASQPGSISAFASNDQDLEDIVNALRQSNFHLGNPNLLQHVCWDPSRRSQLLVESGANNPHGDPVPAILEWVGKISPNNFWLYPCAGWNGELGPNNNWAKVSPFEKAKAKALIHVPNHAILAQDWNMCIGNLNRLMAALTAASQDPNNVLSLVHDNEVRVRHAIFQVGLPRSENT